MVFQSCVFLNKDLDNCNFIFDVSDFFSIFTIVKQPKQLNNKIMEKKVTSYRQGDVLVKKIDKLPEGLKKVEDGLIVEGEAALHCHYLTGNEKGVSVLLDESTDEMYLQIDEDVVDAKIEHLLKGTNVFTGEHLPIAIPAGVWKIQIHQQWNPYAKAIEKVRD